MDATKAIKRVTPESVRDFLVRRYSEPITAMGLNVEELPNDFDLLLSGVIDSFGILEIISAIEKEFEIPIDLGLLDAEDITKIGSLARHIATTANAADA